MVFWCLGHRLELSLKDALKTTFFASINELLVQICFMYEKSPKKCRELDTVVEELKACLSPVRSHYREEADHSVPVAPDS